MAIGTQTKHFYEFGPYCLDATERLLMRAGRSVPLPPKVFETLLVLVENSGRIMEKDELLHTLWPDSFVEESSLSQNIFQLRKALGEGASSPQYIETIPRRGYRFVSSVREARHESHAFLPQPRNPEEVTSKPETWTEPDHESSEPGLTETAVTPVAPGNWRKAAAIALALLLAASAAFGVYRLFGDRRAARASTVPFDLMRMSRLTRTGKVLLQAVSPDGKYVAHVIEDAGQQSLWIRQTATTSNMQIVPPADYDYTGVTFSRDGNYVYYSAYLTRPNQLGIIFQIPVLGGTAKKVAEDIESNLTVSPDGRQLAFVRNYPFLREVALIVVNVDGTGERKLAVRKRPERFSFDGPAWSPDGKIIAVAAQSFKPGGAYMHVIGVNAQDGAETPIGPQHWNWVGQVAWMKDGSGLIAVAWHPNYSVFADQIWYLAWPGGEARRITNDLDGYRSVSMADDASALTTIQSTRVSQIWIVPRDQAGHAVQITSGFGDYYSQMMGMAWLGNKRLVFGSNAGGNTDVWVMDADGRNQKPLTTDGSSDIEPSVSADGSVIVYTSFTAGIPHIWRMDADGSNARQLTSGQGEEAPALSPDGKWVVYVERKESRQAIWKMPVASGEAVLVTDEEARSPVVSPDGKWIGCFVLDKQVKRMRLAVIPFAGGPAKIICKGNLTSDYWGIKWSPDSRALTFILTRNGISNLWGQPIDKGQPKQLTDFRSDRIFRFAWSPDGKSLACERGTTINDIVVVSNFTQTK